MSILRLAFMGTAPFALPALDAVHGAGHDIAAVYTQPPRPAGRGRRLRPSAVHARADELGLQVMTPSTLRREEVQTMFAAFDLDVAIVAAYGLILPSAILDTPRLGCINLHPSLLPRWRGATPAAHTIIHGDTETGLTIFRMDEGLDTGVILSRYPIPVGPRATVESLEAELASLGASLLPGLLPRLEELQAAAIPQDNGKATYARKFAREDGRIDWRRSAAELDRKIRGMTPRPGTYFGSKPGEVKVLEAEPVTGEGPPGTLLNRNLTVACGKGALRLAKVRASGRSTTDGAAWLRGARLEPGAVLA